MTDVASLSQSSRRASSRQEWLVLGSFGVTLFLSALLLFAVQPLFAKMVLPRLGGTPAVWSIAMVFFQAMLLAGYLYAHLLVRYLGIRAAISIHALVLATAFLWLPLGIAEGFETPPPDGEPLWLLSLFLASVGAPFFAVAANAPLLQAWFSRTHHPHAHDPYFLYGASNIGSFFALLSYPILFEPLLALGGQARLWTLGYLALAAAVLACGTIAWAKRGEAAGVTSRTAQSGRASGWRKRAEWIIWAMLPSALLIAVTVHISTNIAAAPFLWVMPLAIFLLTFVLAFQRNRIVPHRTMQIMLPVIAAAALFTVFQPAIFGGLGGIAVNLFALFVIAMTWHGELVARRPAAADLTEFYLCMSIGGVLGGAFASLAAPVLFDSVVEFPLLLAVSILALPEARAALRQPIGLAAAAFALILIGFNSFAADVDYQDRSFFGVTTVRPSPDGRFHLLYHGTTIHGAEPTADVGRAFAAGERPEPLAYYTTEGPLAQAVRIQQERGAGRPISVAVAGLGAGAMACHSAPGDAWRFYEIDPAIIRVATDPKQFNFLSICAPEAPIILGDARLTIAAEPDASFDVVLIDVFSSDAVPVHLMTREALREYASKLKPGGVIVLNITNKFVELTGVVGATAKAEDFSSAWMQHQRTPEELNDLRAYSTVAVISPDAAGLAPFLKSGFKPLQITDSAISPWTDDYSNIVGAILRKQGLL